MKTINIQGFTPPDKTSPFIKNRMFCVFLGNSQRYYFTSQKATNLFLVKTNQFLNSKYRNLNMLYTQVFTEYRKFYLLIDKSQDYKNNVRITDNFKAFEHALDLAPTMSSNNDGNYYAFIHLFKALRALINSCEIIIEYYKARKHYENIYGLNFIVEQLSIIDIQLNTYGIKSEVNEDIILLD